MSAIQAVGWWLLPARMDSHSAVTDSPSVVVLMFRRQSLQSSVNWMTSSVNPRTMHSTHTQVCKSIDSGSQPSSSKSGDVHKTLSHKTETVNLQDQNETKTFHFLKLSRPRRDWDGTLKTEMFQKRLKTAVSHFKNTNWWNLWLDNLFLAGQIQYFLPDISASLMHCMDVHKT